MSEELDQLHAAIEADNRIALEEMQRQQRQREYALETRGQTPAPQPTQQQQSTPAPDELLNAPSGIPVTHADDPIAKMLFDEDFKQPEPPKPVAPEKPQRRFEGNDQQFLAEAEAHGYSPEAMIEVLRQHHAQKEVSQWVKNNPGTSICVKKTQSKWKPISWTMHWMSTKRIFRKRTKFYAHRG